MPIENKIGYDIVYTYTEDELTRMYVKEGMDKETATGKAREVALAINTMTQAERRFWASVRENEEIVGKDPELVDLALEY